MQNTQIKPKLFFNRERGVWMLKITEDLTYWGISWEVCVQTFHKIRFDWIMEER